MTMFDDFVQSVFNPTPKPVEIDCKCAVTGKEVPPEDLGGCNNAEGCDNCWHNEDE